MFSLSFLFLQWWLYTHIFDHLKKKTQLFIDMFLLHFASWSELSTLFVFHWERKMQFRLSLIACTKSLTLDEVFGQFHKLREETRVVVSSIFVYAADEGCLCFLKLHCPAYAARQLEPSTSQWTLSGADQNPKQGNGGRIKRPDYLINACNN